MGFLATLYNLNPIVPVWLVLGVISGITYYYTRPKPSHAHSGHAYSKVATSPVMGGSTTSTTILHHLTGGGQYRWTLVVYCAWVLSFVGLVFGEVCRPLCCSFVRSVCVVC